MTEKTQDSCSEPKLLIYDINAGETINHHLNGDYVSKFNPG